MARRVGALLLAWLLLGTPGAAAQAPRLPLRMLAELNGLPHIGVTDAGFDTALYRNTVPGEFNSITSEDTFKFDSTHPCPPAWLIDPVAHPETFNSSLYDWVVAHGADPIDPAYHCSVSDPAAHEWEWTLADARIAFAAANDLDVFVHTLLWHVANPLWLTDPDVTLSVAERERVMEEHVRGAVRHFAASPVVYGIDVVNEAIAPDGSLLSLSPWAVVPDYIHRAFVVAREELDAIGRADIRLYYNDYEIEYGYARWYEAYVDPPGCYRKSDAVYAYLKELIEQKGTPIDGVGFQTHLVVTGLPIRPCADRADVSRHDTGRMVAMMRRFAALGLEVQITEIDVARRGDGLSDADLERLQVRYFGGALEACLSLRGICTGYTLWGTHDGGSWYDGRPGFPAPQPLIFADPRVRLFDPAAGRCVAPQQSVTDERYCPKAGYHAIGALLLNEWLRGLVP